MPAAIHSTKSLRETFPFGEIVIIGFGWNFYTLTKYGAKSLIIHKNQMACILCACKISRKKPVQLQLSFPGTLLMRSAF